MVSSRLKVLVLSLMVLGAATNAFACGDDKKDNAQASYTSTEGSSCAGKMSAACAAKMAAGECKGTHGSNVSLVAAGEHCSMNKGASMAN